MTFKNKPNFNKLKKNSFNPFMTDPIKLFKFSSRDNAIQFE